MSNSETRWGNNVDLEWLALMSCDVLMLNSASGHVWSRWGPSFDGLHLLMGFGNTGFDVSGMGNNFGDGLADDDEKVRTAWVDASEAEQPNGVIYRYMGVYGANGEWNREDYFHGIGSSARTSTPDGRLVVLGHRLSRGEGRRGEPELRHGRDVAAMAAPGPRGRAAGRP